MLHSSMKVLMCVQHTHTHEQEKEKQPQETSYIYQKAALRATVHCRKGHQEFITTSVSGNIYLSEEMIYSLCKNNANHITFCISLVGTGCQKYWI